MTFHNTFLKTLRFFILIGLLAFVPVMYAQSHITRALSKEKTLKSAKNTSDSIMILLDVYSLSDKINRDRVRGQILNLVQRSDNKEVITHVLQKLSTSTDDTQDLARLIELSDNLPDTNDRSSIQTVLEMEHAQSETSNVSDSEMEKQLADYSRNGMTMGGDPYKEIQNIYRAMMYLGTYSQGPLYMEYMKRLEELVEALPAQDRAIKNLFYTNAAIFYTRKKDYKKAIEFDHQLIGELDAMRARYSDEATADRDLDYFYYLSYRRMLRNFKGLSPEEVEEAFAKCVELAQENEEAAKDFGNGGLTKAYYYMATEQYAKAVPEIQKALAAPNIHEFRRQELLGHLAYAMRKTGNKDGELEALRKYTSTLLNERSERREDMYREIELRNAANKIINEEYMSQEKSRQQNRVMRQTSLTLVYVLAVILIFMCQAYFRLRHKMKELEARNIKLHRNIESIFDDGVPHGTRDLRHQKNKLKG
ncbi:MAG: hypothetical protein J1F16_04140 [Muribaculaceae bacterium]|nr:hypothetical protein [Muribaculaceae bacterium]